MTHGRRRDKIKDGKRGQERDDDEREKQQYIWLKNNNKITKGEKYVNTSSGDSFDER